MSEKLRVEITGDAKELQKATAAASKSLSKFEKIADKSVGGISRPAAKASKAMGGLRKTTANATPTLLEFNRVIQDAPFGIQGVGNNITQLTSQFGYLQKSAGGTKAALKLMLSSLAGPAGILFAVSTAVSLLTVFSSQLNDNRSEAEKNAEATKKASEALEAYADALGDVDKATLKGQQSAQKELLTLKQLRNVAESTTKSTVDRKKAVQELRRLYPSYFKDLSDEKILTGGLSGVYDQLTGSILARAKATAATNLIVKNAEKELIIGSKLAATKFKLLQAEDKALRLNKSVEGALRNNARGADALAVKALRANSAVTDLKETLNELTGQQTGLQLANIDLEQLVNTEGGIDLSGVELKTTGTPEIKVNPKLSISNDSLETLKSSGAMAAKSLQDSIDKQSEKINLDFAEEQLKIGANRLANIKIGEETEFEKSLIAFNERVGSLVTSSVADTFGKLGQSIGEALATGGNVINAIGNTIIQGLGNFLSKMGQLLIEYGTLGVIKGKLDLAIAAGGPLAIGAGIAAIAVGVALSAARGALSSAASGGGGGSTSSGGSGSTSNFSSSGSASGGTVVFEIAGTKLIGVLNRTLDRNSSLGGRVATVI